MDVLARRTNMMSPSTALLRSPSPRAPSFGVSRGNALRNTAKLRGSKSLTFLHSNAGHSKSNTLALPDYGTAGAACSLSSLQVTARGWLASYDNNLSQNFWTGQGNAGARSPQEVQRLPPVASNTALRENFKKEHYATELDRIMSVAEGERPKHHSKDRTLSLEELEKEVKTGGEIHLHEIDKLMKGAHDLHKNFRPQKLQYEVLRKHEGRECDQGRHVEGTGRKVCKKSAQPSNPRWRVEERIRREREQWKDTGEPPKAIQNLPMTQFAVQGERGKEEHSLVDIQAIQAKCRGLSASCSAKSLLDAQRFRDQEAGAMAKKAAEAEVTGTCSQADLDAYASLSWEERVDLAQKKKLQGYISGVFNKMGQMRGAKPPKGVPDSIVNHLHAMGAGDFNWHEAGEC